VGTRFGGPGGEGGIAAAVQQARRDGPVRTVQRVATFAASGRRRPDPRTAADALEAAGRLGFDRLLADHRAAWAHRWDAVDV